MEAPFHLRINKKVSATSHNCDFTNLKIWNSRLFISHICHFIAHKFKSATFISHCDFIHYHSKEGSVRFLFIYCLFFYFKTLIFFGGGGHFCCLLWFIMIFYYYYDYLCHYKIFLFQINAVLLNFLVIKESWKNVKCSHKNINLFSILLRRNVSWAANQHIRMISEGSCDSEDWSTSEE